MMDNDWVVVITGASADIGAALAELVGKKAADLYLRSQSYLPRV